ncbi:MAG: glycosyltransferase family 2 protein [Paludibacteraceae bacterium]|nr:glycosyltransferase family 2 protein [Paludibacteraceae bacterium]
MQLVSIIMPTYNCEHFIAEAIRSVLAQTYTDWELIIVDDCSTDNTAQIVASFDDTRIVYQRNEKNVGAALTRNKALQIAKGHYIAFLDADDLWAPEKLEHQIAFMEKNGYDFTYTVFRRTDKPLRIAGPKHVTRLGMYAFCWPACPTVMYNRQKIGLIQITDLRKNNDYAMWLHVIQKADCYLLNEELFFYNKHAGSVSDAKISVLLKWHYRLWRQEMNCSPITALFYTGLNAVFGAYKKIRYISKIA